MTTEQRTPEQWCQHYGLTIHDPDGWRGPDAPAWEQPIGLPEFWRRFAACTVAHVPVEKMAAIVADVRAAGRAVEQPEPRAAEETLHAAELTGIDAYRRQLDQLLQHAAQLAQQLQVLLQIQPLCATCAADQRQGARPDANFVNVIIDGTGYCNGHVDVVNGRLVPKTGSGIVLGGGRWGR